MDNVIESIWQLMKALVANTSSPLYWDNVLTTGSSTPHGIRAVIKGDPNQIAESDQPAIIVRPVRSNWVQGQSRYDRKEHMVEIVRVENIKNYRETSNKDGRIVQAVVTAMQSMEQSDNTQKTSNDSVIGCLLNNIKLPYTDTSGATQYAAVDLYVEGVDYVFNTSRGFPTFETILSVKVVSQGDRDHS